VDPDPLTPTPASGLPPTGTLYVLDAHGMIFQMFHGVGPMSAPDGRPTNAVFGVTRAIMDLYDHGADYLIAAFDRKGPTFRDKLYREYKAHRQPPPDDLLVQEPMIEQVLEAMRIPMLGVPGYEADDVMATLAVEGAARGLNVFLCTSDKDCRQLLNDRVKILNLRKGETLDAAGLLAVWGVTPQQVVDFQALVGDPTDGVPGVPGVGPKTAAKWLQQYGTLDNLVKHADEVGGPKLQEALKKAIADGTLELSRKLVRLDTRVPLTFDWDGWRRRDWDGQRLLELFQEFGFRGFANKVRATLSASGARRNAELLATVGEAGERRGLPPSSEAVARDGEGKPRRSQGSLFDALDGAADFAFGANAPSADWKVDYKTVDTKKAFDAFLKKLKKQKRFSFDLETTSLDPLRAEMVGYAFSWVEAEAYYLPVRGPAGSKLLDPAETLAALKPVFEDPTVAKVNQNIKYDWLVLRTLGVDLRGVAGDPMVADYLLHAGERSHNLDELARRYLAHENIPITDLIGKGKNQLPMEQVPVGRVRDYACEDADVAWRLAAMLESELETEGLRKLYDEVEVPLIEVLQELEFNGVRLDLPFLQKLSVEMDKQLAGIEAEVHRLAGKKFNLASPKQLREVLFDQMKLPVQKRTGTTNEPSTDQESLERLAALGHELPKQIIEHRQVAKLKGTYVDALPALVNPRTGRVHTSFNQTVASTGRLSSSDPNLQNIPARSEQGRQIRQAFIPRDGWRLLTADYSQVELRLLAHFTGDAKLREAFAADQDIHAAVAAAIFKVPEGQVTAAQRRVAKTVNFGVLYGMSAHGLAVRLGMPRQDAERFIDEYFARYPKVLAYQDDLLRQGQANGYVGTLLGRRRRFTLADTDVKSTYRNRTSAAREAINMEIQGSAADLMKLAMLGVYRRLGGGKFQAKMLLTVHDELVFEVPPREVKKVAALVREEMTGAMTLDVPLKVDVAVGPNWLEVENVE
jgi:DNA polymerase-1